jgi:hypothetical protein
MMLLSSIIQTFEAEFLATYQHVLPSQRNALTALKQCRTTHSPMMLAQCDDCEKHVFIPHSCGHRNCPHCQHHESQQWLDRQLNKQVPAAYFLLTFTLPEELRPLAWQQQRILYDLMIRCSWETLNTFAQNDPQLQGQVGAIAVLHTHSRRLDYHPHVHVVMPAAAIDADKRLWRTKTSKNDKSYLFNHKALAKVFRAKLLTALRETGLELPACYPKTWVVDVKFVGSGDKALVYLGRYLYKGVIQEKDIIACKNGQITFRYQDSKTKKMQNRTLPGLKFLWLILQHVMPKGFRRSRNFGFLHANSKRVLELLQQLIKKHPVHPQIGVAKRPQIKCPCCGGAMRIVRTQIRSPLAYGLPSLSG